jgi:large subunit ribosomal protein L25
MKLTANLREVTGKKVKTLRNEGIVPASIYGPKRASTNIQVDKKEFIKIFKEVGFSNFFELAVGQDKPVRVLVKSFQKNPVTDHLISVDFYQVAEDTKITVAVPVELIGEAPAVKLNLGFLVTPMDQVELHCFPKDLPNAIQIDISKLENVGDAITVGSIELAENVELASSMEPTSPIAIIVAAQKEEEEPKPAETEEGAETPEGTATAEGAAATPAADAK